MAKWITCDRCGQKVAEGQQFEATLVDATGSVESLCEDVCQQCVTALRKFFKPLPQPEADR